MIFSKISRKALFILVSSTLIIITVFYILFSNYQKNITEIYIHNTISVLFTVVKSNDRIFIDEIFDRRVDSIKEHISDLLSIDKILNIKVFDKEYNSLVDDQPFDTNMSIELKNKSYTTKINESYLSFYYKFSILDEDYGFIKIDYSLKQLEDHKKKVGVLFIVIVFVLTGVLFLVFFYLLKKLILKPISKLTNQISEIAKSDIESSIIDFSFSRSLNEVKNSLKNDKINEIEKLDLSFQIMIHKIKEFTFNMENLVDEKTKDLKTAMEDIKRLHGLLPICSICKQIRDDNGYWHEVEKYIGDHTDTVFSHSICPDCMKKNYPDVKIDE
ncbi:MAG: hypothetical protein JXR48_05315 [Candidatus Delongbacteria bacterium]|nr:hypothetical protein [Candidatus Delongbacteria bacterium]MBN2834368.1 hypothetical protein [Candidatus Delongbacteria bacterium]